MMVRDIIATIRDLEYQSRQFDALTQRVRGGVEKEIRRHNEAPLWERLEFDENSKLMIAGEFMDLSRNELIRSLNQQSVEFRHPQPVNMTPGALGVRCEE